MQLNTLKNFEDLSKEQQLQFLKSSTGTNFDNAFNITDFSKLTFDQQSAYFSQLNLQELNLDSTKYNLMDLTKQQTAISAQTSKQAKENIQVLLSQNSKLNSLANELSKNQYQENQANLYVTNLKTNVINQVERMQKYNTQTINEAEKIKTVYDEYSKINSGETLGTLTEDEAEARTIALQNSENYKSILADTGVDEETEDEIDTFSIFASQAIENNRSFEKLASI